MQVILSMAMTANGMIATSTKETPWSEEERSSFAGLVQETKNLIIGRTTYEEMKRRHEFQKLGDPLVLVLTKSHYAPLPRVVFVRTPQEALAILQQQGFTQALVAGGSQTNAFFLRERLINDIYLDVEPFLFSKGVPLFADPFPDTNLQLIETRQLSPQTIQLHYRVAP